MKNFLTACCLLLAFYTQSQIPFFKWANAFPMGKIAHDASGNLYATGNFSGSGDFDPGPAVLTLTSFGLQDIFMMKIDPNGNLVWVKQIGSAGDDQGMDIAIDASGNIILASYFSSTVNYNPGGTAVNLASSGSSDIAIAKYDGNGNNLWAKKIGGPNTDIVKSLALDASGNVYSTGYFSDPVDFDPSAASYTLTTTTSVNDAFVLKLDANGNFLWAKDLGGTANTIPNAITVDASGNAYTTGEFTGTCDFDPSGTAYNLSSFGGSVKDCYISKLDASGNFVWAKQVGGTGQDLGYCVRTDTGGDVYITGNYSGTGDFDPSAATFNMSTTAANNGFVLKLSASGTLVWAKQTQGSSAGTTIGLRLDASANLYLSGRFSGTVDFDPDATTSNLTSFGATDVFLASWTSSGTHRWAQQFGGTGSDMDEAITLDAQENIILSGSYSGLADFDPGVGTYSLSVSGGEFILKLATCPTVTISLISQNNVSCNGMSDGSATVAATGGSGITYNWLSGQTTASIMAIGAGVYTAIATNSCANTASIMVTITQPPAFSNTNAGSQTICQTQSVSLHVTASGGVPPYTYNWTPSTGLNASNASTVIASPAATTTYTFTAVDANGCGTGGSLNVTVNSLKDISGTVTESSNPVAGEVTLYAYQPFLTKFDSVTTRTINGAGAYTFTSVPTGSYIVKATPTASTLQVTYGSSAISWKNATVMTHSCIAASSQSISVQPFASLVAGTGSLSGKIVEGQGFGQRPSSPYSPLAPGNPIGGIIVKGGKNPGGSMFAQTTTSSNGTYTLSNLPNNTAGESYFILVDIPGLDTNNTYHKIISLNSPQYTNLDFVVDSAKVNPLPPATGIKSLSKTGEGLSLYPNPAKNSVSIFYAVANAGPVIIELFDVLGKKAKTLLQEKYQQAGDNHLTAGLEDLNAGIYFLKVTAGGHERVCKLVISD